LGLDSNAPPHNALPKELPKALPPVHLDNIVRESQKETISEGLSESQETSRARRANKFGLQSGGGEGSGDVGSKPSSAAVSQLSKLQVRRLVMIIIINTLMPVN
jgi:hypothetical protein